MAENHLISLMNEPQEDERTHAGVFAQGSC